MLILQLLVELLELVLLRECLENVDSVAKKVSFLKKIHIRLPQCCTKFKNTYDILFWICIMFKW